jgi:hypothetical protein
MLIAYLMRTIDINMCGEKMVFVFGKRAYLLPACSPASCCCSLTACALLLLVCRPRLVARPLGVRCALHHYVQQVGTIFAFARSHVIACSSRASILLSCRSYVRADQFLKVPVLKWYPSCCLSFHIKMLPVRAYLNRLTSSYPFNLCLVARSWNGRTTRCSCTS